MIKVKIDVTKLDEARFFKGKNGAVYCDLVLFENKNGTDQYGNDYGVKQDSTKEDREAGVQMPYVGNGKTMGQPQPKQQPAKKSPPPQQQYKGEQKEYPADDGQEIPW